MMVPSNASCWTVILVLIRRECGSVQRKEASMILTLLRPRSLRRQRARSSRDSGAAVTHEDGGESHRSQSRHV